MLNKCISKIILYVYSEKEFQFCFYSLLNKYLAKMHTLKEDGMKFLSKNKNKMALLCRCTKREYKSHRKYTIRMPYKIHH